MRRPIVCGRRWFVRGQIKAKSRGQRNFDLVERKWTTLREALDEFFSNIDVVNFVSRKFW